MAILPIVEAQRFQDAKIDAAKLRNLNKEKQRGTKAADRFLNAL